MAACNCSADLRAAAACAACRWAWRNSLTAVARAARLPISAPARKPPPASPATAKSLAAARNRSPSRVRPGPGRRVRGPPGRRCPPRSAGPDLAANEPPRGWCRPPPRRRRRPPPDQPPQRAGRAPPRQQPPGPRTGTTRRVPRLTSSLADPAWGGRRPTRGRIAAGGQGVASSNPAVPTDFRTALGPFWDHGLSHPAFRWALSASPASAMARWSGCRYRCVVPSRASPSRSSPRPDRTVPIPFAGRPGLPD